MAQAKPQPALIGLDTNFLIDLADGDEECLDCLGVLRAKRPKVAIVLLPVVVKELTALYLKGNPVQKKLAEAALRKSLKEWGIAPAFIVPVQLGIAEIVADAIRVGGIVPIQERNDSFLIAEAAVLGCNLLISSDAHVHGVNKEDLRQVLTASHVECPVIMTPGQVYKKFHR